MENFVSFGASKSNGGTSSSTQASSKALTRALNEEPAEFNFEDMNENINKNPERAAAGITGGLPVSKRNPSKHITSSSSNMIPLLDFSRLGAKGLIKSNLSVDSLSSVTSDPHLKSHSLTA